MELPPPRYYKVALQSADHHPKVEPVILSADAYVESLQDRCMRAEKCVADLNEQVTQARVEAQKGWLKAQDLELALAQAQARLGAHALTEHWRAHPIPTRIDSHGYQEIGSDERPSASEIQKAMEGVFISGPFTAEDLLMKRIIVVARCCGLLRP